MPTAEQRWGKDTKLQGAEHHFRIDIDSGHPKRHNDTDVFWGRAVNTQLLGASFPPPPLSIPSPLLK